MAVSEERIDELLELMLANADDDGWCHVPEGLSEEEEKEISKRLAMITMQDRIDMLLEGILEIIKYMDNIRKHLDEYETMDRLKIKGGLASIKEDSEGLLMDLHSEDILTDFFKIEMISGEDINEEETKKVKATLEDLVKNDFKEQLGKVKEYCMAIIEMGETVANELDEQ